MVRPRIKKCIGFHPNVTYFKPKGVPLRELEKVDLTLDELETLRLSNLENLSQIDSADKMQIHQSTFQRTLVRAREKITDALVNGKAIMIHGGEYKMSNKDGTGPFNQGRRSGCGFRIGTQNAGHDGVCLCLKCGYEKQHIKGQPCSEIKCPKCETLMTRK